MAKFVTDLSVYPAVQNTNHVSFSLVTTLGSNYPFIRLSGNSKYISGSHNSISSSIDNSTHQCHLWLKYCYKTVILPYETLLYQSYILYIVSDFVRFLIWHSIAGIPISFYFASQLPYFSQINQNGLIWKQAFLSTTFNFWASFWCPYSVLFHMCSGITFSCVWGSFGPYGFQAIWSCQKTT